jgi:hypothetical protein
MFIYDSNNLLERGIELQKELYLSYTNNNSIQAQYLDNLNILLDNYIKYGINSDQLIYFYYEIENILYY